MSHNVSVSQNPNDPGTIGRLTIAAPPKNQPSGKRNTLRVSRVSGGLRFHAEDGATHVYGEDLFALRELLAELPEELFVRPADPVELPDWVDGDIVTTVIPAADFRQSWQRGLIDADLWSPLVDYSDEKDASIRGGAQAEFRDDIITRAVNGDTEKGRTLRVVRQRGKGAAR